MLYALLIYGSTDMAIRLLGGSQAPGRPDPHRRLEIELLPVTTAVTFRVDDDEVVDGAACHATEDLLAIQVCDAEDLDVAITAAQRALESHPIATACEVRPLSPGR
jgi:hypothetical protein